MNWILDRLTLALLSFSYEMSNESNESVRSSTIYGHWFLSPKQHLIELLLLNSILLISSLYFLSQSKFKFSHSKPRGIFDWLFIISIIASLSVVIFYKYKKHSLIFLLQPCHMSMFVLLTVFLLKRTWKLTTILFNVYIHLAWGTLLALLTPDLRGYEPPVEVYNFYIEHYLLLAAPMYLIIHQKLSVFDRNILFCVASFSLKALYHSFVLTPVALWSGKNLNYVLVPPPGFLENFGIAYRPVMYVACFPITVVMRYIVVEGFVRVVGWMRLKLKKE